MSQDSGWQDVSHELYEGDGWQDISHELPQAESTVGAAALQGFGKGAAFGYTPQLNAISEPGTNAVLNALASTELGAKMMGVPQNPDVETNPDYVGRRDEFIKMQNKLAEENPKTNLASTLAGGLVTGIATAGMGGGGIAATRLGRVAQAAKAGAIYGGIANPGDTEGEISPLQPIDRAGNAGKGAALGAAIQGGAEVGSKVLGPPMRKAADIIAPKLKTGWQNILDAAEALGIKPTPAMLEQKGGFVQRMEDSLQESPSILGSAVRKNRTAVQDKLAGTASDLGADASTLTPFQIGDNFKSGVSGKINDRADAAGKIFDDVAESTRHIPVSEKSLNAVGRNIENMDTFRLLPGGKPQQYRDMISNVQNANDVKTVLTLLGKDIKASEGAEKSILIAMQDKLQGLEKNSVMRSAIQAAKEGAPKNEFAQMAAGDEGQQTAMGLINDLKSARKDWRGIHEDMNAIGKPAGINSNGGPGAFNSKLDAIPSQSIQDKFLNPQKLEGVNALRMKFPQEFDLLRKGKIRDVMDASLYKGDVSAQRFVKEAGKLDPEMQSVLFGDQAGKINQMKTLVDALPERFNPSGTSGQSMFSKDGVIANITDIPRYGMYKAASNNSVRQSIADKLNSGAASLDALTQSPRAVGNTAGAMINPNKPFDAAPEPTKMMDKNFINILGKNPELLNKIKDPRLREAMRKQLQNKPQVDKDPRQSFIEGN